MSGFFDRPIVPKRTRHELTLEQVGLELQTLAARLEQLGRRPTGDGSATGKAIDRISMRDDAWRGAAVVERQIERLIRLRRMRGEFFPAELFADPVTDLLLHLMASWLRDEALPVGLLVTESGLDEASALSALDDMERHGLVAFADDPLRTSGRLVWLTEDAARRAARVLDNF